MDSLVRGHGFLWEMFFEGNKNDLVSVTNKPYCGLFLRDQENLACSEKDTNDQSFCNSQTLLWLFLRRDQETWLVPRRIHVQTTKVSVTNKQHCCLYMINTHMYETWFVPRRKNKRLSFCTRYLVLYRRFKNIDSATAQNFSLVFQWFRGLTALVEYP